jgi:16S rRNA (uracil1498-N3)-methyltransferase
MKYHQMTRLFVEDSLEKENIILNNSLDVNYLANAMRKKVGHQLLLFNPQDGEYIAKILEINNKKVILQPIEKIREYKKEKELTLIFAPIKQARMHFLLEKATELGVTKLMPNRTKHSVVDKINFNKWYIYTKEASEQCGRLSMPEIKSLEALNQFLSNWPKDQRIILCNEREKDLSLANYLTSTNKEEINIMVGPEGGFSDQELELLLSKDFVTSVHLGPGILRAETASLYALSLSN